MITQGMPLSIRVQSTPSMRSVTLPVGSSAPQLDPAVSLNSSGIAAAVPGTPSMAVAPTYRTWRAGVCTRACAVCPVFSMKMVTGVSPSCALISPRSMAKGWTPARMLPRFCASVTMAWSTAACRNR